MSLNDRDRKQKVVNGNTDKAIDDLSYRYRRNSLLRPIVLSRKVFSWVGRSLQCLFSNEPTKIMIKLVGLGGLGVTLKYFFGFSLPFSILSVFSAYLLTGGWRFIRIVILTLPRDLRGGFFLAYSMFKIKSYVRNHKVIADLFEKTVKRHPNKLALVMVDGAEWTFKEVDEYSNKIANFLLSKGFQKDDCIALYMESKPEYVCMWLAMNKIGVRAALINFNLKMQSLAHCIHASNAKALIYSNELKNFVEDAKDLIGSNLDYMCSGDGEPGVVNNSLFIDSQIKSSSAIVPPKDPNRNFNEQLFYVYTSGTTGLPKAAKVINSRFYYMAAATHFFFKMSPDEVIYCTLPLYHTAGGVLGVGQVLVNGCTLVIRKKFSASRFWDDCIKYNASATQYIGEIARYLLAQPKKPTDRRHRVRLAFGNGLRPQVWVQYMQRYGIERIGEFYGSTEGNANIINIDNKVGCVGFTTRIVPFLYPIRLIRVDEVTGEPLRDKNGLCIPCQPDQPGELVGKIVKGNPLREFDGYSSSKDSDKKIIRNVFSRGDQAFATGDVLVMDELGYMYFRDRTGDTFRWRGENVSTAEVEATISNILKLTDAVVYGVEVPGVEGRAGMVAIVDPERQVDLNLMYKEMQKALPPYSHPMFVRLLQKVETTGTFKLKKVEIRKEGFNPNIITDSLFYLDSRKAEYLPIDPQVYQAIESGKIRF